MRLFTFILVVFSCSVIWAQNTPDPLTRTISLAVSDTLIVDSVSVSPHRLLVYDTKGQLLPPSEYEFDAAKATLYLSENLQQTLDSVTVHYVAYPSFLTRKYSLFDEKIIADGTAVEQVYKMSQSTRTNTFTPFDGLTTYGSISRGITIGNNQNTVVTSELDLQITGKLSDKVSIRASIQDANIPMQEGGYSQSLDEFDQIFVELFTDDWHIRAGDIDLVNKSTFFGNFEKKVQGVLVGAKIQSDQSETTVFASGAVVKGVFSKTSFNGQEGNQGPYKLVGPDGELYVLIISGSERVYVNGLLLERGEDKDYVIDYNAGEIRFNPTFPITSEMRILVEYQYTDRKYTRFTGFGGGHYQEEKFEIGAYYYIESDSKNQPLQQNLTEEQVQILKNAGDNSELMTAPSAVSDTYSDNKILYKKELFNGQEIFVFSNNPEDELFFVRFSYVGENQGNYIVADQTAINRIYEFVPPVNGVLQGNYEPIVRLFAPTRLQLGGVQATYKPNDKNQLGVELAVSNNDLNLFSEMDKEDDTGFAGRIQWNRELFQIEGGSKFSLLSQYNFIHRDFVSVERYYNVEFERDWHLPVTQGNVQDMLTHQSFLSTALHWQHPQKGSASYEFQKLDFTDYFSGNRQVLRSQLQLNKLTWNLSTSMLHNNTPVYKTNFFRIYSGGTYDFGKAWAGIRVQAEDNVQRFKYTDSLSILSQRYQQYETFVGVGDSTQVFVEGGYRYRTNDSLRNNQLQRVTQSHTWYIKSQLLKTETSQLSVYANYRNLRYLYDDRPNDQSINGRILYNQSFLNRAIQWNTSLETNSGVMPQQEYTFVEVEPGQGTHTWIDYNGNGIQELEEFEIAPFPDEARYIKVLLPNQIFIKIHNNKLGQTLILNPAQYFLNREGGRLWSKFYNQTSFLIDRKTRKDGNKIDLNPFNSDPENQMGLTLSFRNSLFFNRGKQHFTTGYSYTVTDTEHLFTAGRQKNSLRGHQLHFTHKFWESWLFNANTAYNQTQLESENYESRNYIIDTYQLEPKISYLFSDNARLSLLYEWSQKENTTGDQEQLLQQTLGLQLSFHNAEKYAINGDFNYISNDFTGNPFSPVAFQMLDGLQPGENYTWTLLFQRKITNYLDVNLSYFGRKSETSKAIHTGSVQLKAYF